MDHQGSREVGPLGVPSQLYPVCRVISWMKVRRAPSLVGCPPACLPAGLCRDLTPSSHQQTSKNTQT